MNNFTYFNDEWNSPIVEGTSQPPLYKDDSLQLPQLHHQYHNKTKNVQ
jgi:hypothetical protein